MSKRISQRKYPEKKCLQCPQSQSFIPSDARQVFCSVQHRIDFHNAKRKITNAPYDEFIRKLKRNDAVLEKYFNPLKEKTITGPIPEVCLLLEGYDFAIYSEIGQNPVTKTRIVWSLRFGIEASQDLDRHYIICKKDF